MSLKNFGIADAFDRKLECFVRTVIFQPFLMFQRKSRSNLKVTHKQGAPLG
jgi:hypothetical protein